MWLGHIWALALWLLAITLPEPWLWFPVGLVLLEVIIGLIITARLARSRCPRCGGFFFGFRGRRWPAMNIYRSTCGGCGISLRGPSSSDRRAHC